MKNKITSIFNLIEIFRNQRPKKIVSTINTETHCAQKHMHDFYCDAERPYID
ncbi:hypothetical protein HNV08_05350 [Winogradskyella eckloniae]|uniref:hypothetical protein n=1 Tax=Winogradskyella eckloniae TaxID=1089306 RepID=UPI0015659847|nr:hypothetical protein [Winogradskyella eckloniae]NRD19465.1 hypothetical protein [Winogradskyella eckloniae]